MSNEYPSDSADNSVGACGDHMPSPYFETLFRRESNWADWPPSFCIITACATTGESWSEERTRIADCDLKSDLQRRCLWIRRLTGYSPTTGHAEPGWAAELGFDVACDLGRKYLQDAIYFVERDSLYVSYCDNRRKLTFVGEFRCRVH